MKGGKVRGEEWGSVCSPDQRAAMLLHPHNNRTTSFFKNETDQSDGPIQTYSSHFAVRSGAHRKHCL